MPDPLVETVISALAEVKHVPPERISIDTTFAELNVDSLDAITLLFELESRLDLVIPDEAAKSAGSVRDIVEGLRALIASGPAQPATPPKSASQ